MSSDQGQQRALHDCEATEALLNKHRKLNADTRDQLVAALAERDTLRADQEDWRKGVALIASALGEADSPNLSCVRLADVALRMRAALEEIITGPDETADHMVVVAKEALHGA